jgi:hypothetical protein
MPRRGTQGRSLQGKRPAAKRRPARGAASRGASCRAWRAVRQAACCGAALGVAVTAALCWAPAWAGPADNGNAAGAAGLADVVGATTASGGPAKPAYSQIDGDTVHPCPGWPVWLKDFHRDTRTEKTSDIAYAGRDPEGRRCFFLADEIGQLRFCRVAQAGDSGEVDLRIEDVGIGPSLLESLPLDRSWDFEGLGLDLNTGHRADHSWYGAGPWAVPDSVDGVLSIEGQGTTAEEDTRLLAIRLRTAPGAPGAASRWHIESLGDVIPGARFWRGQIKPDLGFEGVAISPGYYWFGLESLEERDELHTRGSVLYIYDRASGQIGTLPTRDWGIHTICGLAAPSDTVTIVADRNRQSLFVLRWARGTPGRLTARFRFPLDLPAPGGFRYAIPTVEGVAVDEGGDFWCVIDPWRGHYQPVGAAPESVLVYLAAEIPMLYRFPGAEIWRTAGLSGLWPDGPREPGRPALGPRGTPGRPAAGGEQGKPQGGAR